MVVESVPLLNVVPPIVKPFDLIIMAPDAVKLSFSVIAPKAFRVTAPGAVMPPLVASSVIVPPEDVSETPEARTIPSPVSVELFESPSKARFPTALMLLSIANPLVAAKVIAPCPVMLPPLCPITSFPVRFTEVPVATVILPFTRLRSPVIKASSALLRFIPEKPETKPNPRAPLFETLRVVALVPGLSDPVKTKSLAVILRALLVVDTAPVIVVVPVPEFRAIVPFAERPAMEIPELAVKLAVVTDVSELLAVMLPVEFKVSEPLFDVIVDPAKVILAPEIFIPLARESELPP